MTTDIVVVGSIFMDLICYADRLPVPGETIGGNDFKTGYGGKGANQCVAAQRLGSKTSFIGKIGKDAYGQQYYNNLKSEGVNVEGIKFEDDVPTGVASIMVGNDNGQNIIITVAGANGLITGNYIQETAENIISNSKVLICQMEIPIDATRMALTLARNHGILSIFNVAPANFNLPMEMYELADILCLNESEAEMVCGIQNIRTRTDAEQAIEKLKCNCKCKTVIITLGSEGALMWDHKNKTYLFEAAPSISVVDTTGAGDCFVGTLAHCLAKEHDNSFALRKAVHNASESVTKKGTQSSFPFAIIEK